MSDYHPPSSGPDQGESGAPYLRRRDRRQAQQYRQQSPQDTYEPDHQESFRNQTLSGDYRVPADGPDEDLEYPEYFEPGPHGRDGNGYGAPYDYPRPEVHEEYQEYGEQPEYGGYDQFGDYAGTYERPTPNPQFAQVYHQPYNQPHEYAPEYDGPDDPEQEYDEDHFEDEVAYETPRLQDEERAAYQADFQRTLARNRYEDDEDPVAPPADEPRTAPPTPPAVTKTGMSAAPVSFPFPGTARGGVPAQRSPLPSSVRPGPSARPPVEKLPPRRRPQRRPSPAARGFVPSQDRIGTAREVMGYLARRPWLQLDVVDIILGTQFDRDDVAHALIVLQQTGRIRSHLRGDRVCYSYAATESVT